MLGDITIGQYYNGTSPLHRLDARVKLLALIAFIVTVFLCKNVQALLLCVLITLLAVILSRVPVKMYLKGLKAIWLLILITTVLNCAYASGSRVLFSIWSFDVTYEGVRQSCFIGARLVMLIILSSVLTFTTSPNELTAALESLLSPFAKLGLKVHELAMMMTIALRFVPTLLEEAQKIMSAQKARGADFESGGLITRIKAVIPILVPLFASAFRRAYDLALAMECRCYTDGTKRTKLNPLRLRFADCASAVLIAALCVGVFMLGSTPHFSVLLRSAGELVSRYA